MVSFITVIVIMVIVYYFCSLVTTAYNNTIINSCLHFFSHGIVDTIRLYAARQPGCLRITSTAPPSFINKKKLMHTI